MQIAKPGGEMASPNEGGGIARPLGESETWGEERWSIPQSALLITASSLALWTGIIWLLRWLLG
jgi:hypothetical protein